MAKAIGVESKAAIKKASDWGVAVACGANDGILILPPGIKRDRDNHPDNSLGLYFAKSADLGAIKCEGDLPMYMRYDGLDLLMALLMGSTGGAPEQQGETSAYLQSLILADNNDGLFATLAINKNVNIDEFPGLKIAGFTFKGETGKPCELVLHALADDKVVDSSVNTSGTFASVTFFETANRVLFSQLVARMNAQAGDALGSGDVVAPNSFELVCKRNMEGVHAAGQADKIDEPTNAGPPEVTLKLAFPRFTATTYITELDAKNHKKMDLVFTGTEIATPYNRKLTVSFPNLMLTNAEDALEEGIVKHPLEFVCLAVDSAPTGMSGITKPFQVEIINRQTADVLA